MRDLPAPRETDSAVGPFLRRAFAWPYRVALAGLYRTGARAWHLTLLSLAVNALVAWLLLTGQRVLPGVLLLPAGLLDVLDGGIARLRGTAGRAGAFMDSVLDRVSDFLIFGALFWSLSAQGNRGGAALALGALVVTLMVSHVRAEAEAIGLSLAEGLFQRIERYLALILGLTIPGALLPALAVLATLGAVTVGQRLVSAWRQSAPPRVPDRSPGQEGSDPPHGPDVPHDARKKSDKNGPST